MRQWRNALLPLCTLLAVLCLALLPPRLSQRGDRGLMGEVHAENLSEDSNFPSRPPPLSGRVWLAAQLNDWPEALTVVDRELEGEELDQAGTAALAELRALAELGILPEELSGEDAVIYGKRGYVRDRTDLASARFLEVSFEWRKTGEFLRVALDGETGKTLSLDYVSPVNRKRDWDMETVGRTFLERLELDGPWEPVTLEKEYAFFSLPESHVTYSFLVDSTTLRVILQMDWSVLESGLTDAEAYGFAGDAEASAGR